MAEFGREKPEKPKTSPQEPTQNRVAAVTQKPQLNTPPRSQDGGNFRRCLIPLLASVK